MTFLAPYPGQGFLPGRDASMSRALSNGGPGGLLDSAVEYAVDAGQRAVLFWDAMRQAGNIFVEHEKEGCPPVLFFQWDMVEDGRHLFVSPGVGTSRFAIRFRARPEITLLRLTA